MQYHTRPKLIRHLSERRRVDAGDGVGGVPGEMVSRCFFWLRFCREPLPADETTALDARDQEDIVQVGTPGPLSALPTSRLTKWR